MKRKLLLFLLSICFFLPDFAATGQYNFIRVDGGSGLSNSHVKSIIQDSYGFIWLGTRNGLNRYDGVSMKLYNCYDETLQHGNQVISALFEDNHRQLWVGTDDGVYIQELATGKFRPGIYELCRPHRDLSCRPDPSLQQRTRQNIFALQTLPQ